MSETDRLHRAVEGLYEAFSQYRLREQIAACNHCHGSEHDRLIRSKKLRELGVDELHHYIWDAMTTWGDDYDFRHFLPRVLEIYAQDQRLGEYLDPPIVLGKIQYAHWTNWPMKEQEAVRRYLSALWISKVNQEFPWEDFSPSLIEDWLCAIGRAEDDLHPYLAIWEDAHSSAAIGNLFHFIVSVQKELAKKELQNAFWKDRRAQSTQVARWLLGEKVKQKLKIASAEFPSVRWTDRALGILDLLT